MCLTKCISASLYLMAPRTIYAEYLILIIWIKTTHACYTDLVTQTHTFIYIYIYIYVCVCVCVFCYPYVYSKINYWIHQSETGAVTKISKNVTTHISQSRPYISYKRLSVNSSPPWQNGRHFADDLFKWIFKWETSRGSGMDSINPCVK